MSQATLVCLVLGDESIFSEINLDNLIVKLKQAIAAEGFSRHRCPSAPTMRRQYFRHHKGDAELQV